MNDHGTFLVAATIGSSEATAAASLVAATLGSGGAVAGLGDPIALHPSDAYALAVSGDGRIVAHGAPEHAKGDNPAGNGSVVVHRWSVATSAWEQMGGLMAGNSQGDGFGESVAISADGMVLAVGAASSKPVSHATVNLAGGYVHVFDFDEGANDWVQRGAQLTGEDGSHGRSVALSADGHVLAIGEYNHDGPTEHCGRVLVYSWDYVVDHEWKLVDEISGEFRWEEFGWSVALSDDGATLVVGAQRGEQVGNGIFNSDDYIDSPNQARGHVRVYVAAEAQPPPPPTPPSPPFLSRFDDYAQVGVEMRGYARADFAGVAVAMSRDGTTLVFGAPENTEFMSYEDRTTSEFQGPGYVEVHRFDANSQQQWSMAGSRLAGQYDSSRYGNSVAVSADGSRIAIGSVAYNHVVSTVRVYDWDAAQDDWSPVPEGDGVAIHNQSVRCGNSLAMSDDGSVIATGCVEGGTIDVGVVKLIKWDAVNSEWTRHGQDLVVEHNDHMVALSGDGRVVAIGTSRMLAFSDPLYDSGRVLTYAWDDALDEWVQRGNAFQSLVRNEYLGASVALSADGSVLAIGAPSYYGANDPLEDAGTVGIFRWEGGEWVAMGAAIVGPYPTSHIGESVALSAHGDVVAIGAHAMHAYDPRDRTENGHFYAQVHAWDSVAGAWSEVGSGIDAGSDGGMSIDAYSSVALSGDGTRMAVGAWPWEGYPDDDGDVWSPGLVRVYDAVASG